MTQFELLPRPPEERAPDNPWPLWPNIFRTSSAHEEGGERDSCISTTKLERRNGCVERKKDAAGRFTMEEAPGSAFEIPAQLVLLAMGFLGPERDGMLAQLGVKIDERGNVEADEDYMTSVPGVFSAGDMRRGQSLIVWAIAEGRKAARGADQYLMGSTDLPYPLTRPRGYAHRFCFENAESGRVLLAGFHVSESGSTALARYGSVSWPNASVHPRCLWGAAGTIRLEDVPVISRFRPRLTRAVHAISFP